VVESWCQKVKGVAKVKVEEVVEEVNVTLVPKFSLESLQARSQRDRVMERRQE
jgi:hypothetical protein